MKINAEWHLANRMPKNPTLKERARWHFEHEKHCQCRTMTKKLREALANALK